MHVVNPQVCTPFNHMHASQTVVVPQCISCIFGLVVVPIGQVGVVLAIDSSSESGLPVVSSANNNILNVFKVDVLHAIVANDGVLVVPTHIVIVNIGESVHIRVHFIQRFLNCGAENLIFLVLVLHGDSVRVHTVVIVPVVNAHLSKRLNSGGS